MKKEKQYLNVICPMCGAFKNKECTHTSRAKKGKKRTEPHEDRVKLACVKVQKFAIREDKPAKKVTPHEKLTAEQKSVVRAITDKIEILGGHVEFVGPVTTGPIVDTYRFFPVKRTRVSQIEQMNKDFAVALGADNVLVKRMPGESAIGVFVPKKERIKVIFGDTIKNVSAFMKLETEDNHQVLPMNLGIDSDGEPMVDDLSTQPHVLIAGSTGSGKSTAQHSIAASMMLEMSPEKVKVIISDTKGVEFKAFAHVPHLQVPICKTVYETMSAMQWVITESQKRLKLFEDEGVRNIHEYNERQISEGKLPYIVIFIDELADIIAEGPGVDRGEAKINASKLGTIVARSRAAGVHVIAATQRPSVNIVKGSIKSNFPTRLAFKLPSSMDSRTVLNTKGAESLMKRGDGLYSSSTSSELKRIHAPYLSLDELKVTIEGIMQRHAPEVIAGNQAEKADSLFGKEAMYKHPN